MLRMSRIFNFLKKKDQIFRKIRENFGNVQIIQKIIQNYSVVSLGIALKRRPRRRAPERAGARDRRDRREKRRRGCRGRRSGARR